MIQKTWMDNIDSPHSTKQTATLFRALFCLGFSSSKNVSSLEFVKEWVAKSWHMQISPKYTVGVLAETDILLQKNWKLTGKSKEEYWKK